MPGDVFSHLVRSLSHMVCVCVCVCVCWVEYIMPRKLCIRCCRNTCPNLRNVISIWREVSGMKNDKWWLSWIYWVSCHCWWLAVIVDGWLSLLMVGCHWQWSSIILFPALNCSDLLVSLLIVGCRCCGDEADLSVMTIDSQHWWWTVRNRLTVDGSLPSLMIDNCHCL